MIQIPIRNEVFPIETLADAALPKSRAYINSIPPAKLRRLIHHLRFSRLVMMNSCNCLLGFEGEYNKECRNTNALEAESEMLDFPAGNDESEATNHERSQCLLRIAIDTLARKERKRGKRYVR